ncbi:uncharacterized protein METZ01_LOCUS219893, partial [marine metagenome]
MTIHCQESLQRLKPHRDITHDLTQSASRSR